MHSLYKSEMDKKIKGLPHLDSASTLFIAPRDMNIKSLAGKALVA